MSLTTHLREVLRDPQWNGRTPVAISGDGPIAGILEPVVKSFLLHKLRNPMERRKESPEREIAKERRREE